MNSELDDNFNYACFDEFLILKRQMSGKTVKGYDWSKIIIIVCNILIYINTKKLQHPKMLQIITEHVWNNIWKSNFYLPYFFLFPFNLFYNLSVKNKTLYTFFIF